MRILILACILGVVGCEEALEEFKIEAIQAGRERISRHVGDTIDSGRNEIRETLVPANDPDEFDSQVGGEENE